MTAPRPVVPVQEGTAHEGFRSRSKERHHPIEPLLTAHQHKVVFEWNLTEGPYPDTDCLFDGLERQAHERPTQPAVVTASRTIPYGPLLDLVQQLAGYLRRRGVKHGDLVGIGLHRSIEMVAAVLAVTRLGAAYVPLDPSYPRARLAEMLRDAQAPFLITQSALTDLFRDYDGVGIDLDATVSEWSSRPPDKLPRLATPDDIAYVMYTSGSTGKPKGVVVRHRAAVNTIDWVNTTFGVGPGDRLLAVASLSFDLSVYDVFGTLAAGATIRLADQHEVRDPARLHGILCNEGITIWNSAPAALQQLVPFLGERGTNEALRLVLLSGDWIPITLPGQIRQRFPAARVISLGGATEAAIWSNWFPVDRVDPEWRSIPYGKPIRNARYYILDDNLQPVAIGDPGELFIGGVCLADGYLGQP
ncbi:MAG: AMP-binding protein, partial [Nitrospira sp.]|nr:AMP-binding protein [Nitrospira sp.]